MKIDAICEHNTLNMKYFIHLESLIFIFNVDITSHIATYSHIEEFSHLRVPQTTSFRDSINGPCTCLA